MATEDIKHVALGSPIPEKWISKCEYLAKKPRYRVAKVWVRKLLDSRSSPIQIA